MKLEKTIASGYPQAAVRLEHRPLVNLHTREELIDILDALERCGVDAWWYGAAAKGSYPLFPSKHLPWREQVDRELLPWLVEQAHKRGIALMSWEYLNTAPLLAEQPVQAGHAHVVSPLHVLHHQLGGSLPFLLDVAVGVPDDAEARFDERLVRVLEVRHEDPVQELG